MFANRNKRIAIFGFSVAAVFLLLFMFFENPRDDTVSDAAQNNWGQSTNDQSSTESVGASSIAKKDPRIGGKFSALPALTNAPIEFYGKVIDEEGAPMSGVKVIGHTGSAMGFMAHEYRNYETQTDQSGYFSFTRIKGSHLGFEFVKSGFIYKTHKKGFQYSAMTKPEERHKPDKSKPIEFTMWKIWGPEPLIDYHARRISVPTDGAAIFVNLSIGKAVESGGDIKLSAVWGERPSKDSIVYDWVFQIEVMEGGLVDGTEEIMFHAPNEGYVTRKEYKFTKVNNPADTALIFYVKCRHGQSYARVQMSFNNSEIASVCYATLRVQMNPNGSRNLEPGGETIDVRKLDK